MTHPAKKNAIAWTVVVGLGLGVSSPAVAQVFGHWSFDECSGTVVYDSSPCENDGTISSDSMWCSPGYDGLGCALEFDGYQGDTYVTVPHDDSLNFNGSIYLSAWVKHLPDPGENTLDPILCKGQSSVPYAFYVNDRGLEFLGNYQTGGTEFVVITDPDLIQDDVWTHVAAFYDQNYVRLFISDESGQLQLVKEEPVSYAIVNNEEPLYFGIDYPGFNERFTGCIDEVVVAAYSPGDLNGDGCVDQSDLGILLADWNCTGGDCPGDCDGDGDTDHADLGLMLTHWGEGCP